MFFRWFLCIKYLEFEGRLASTLLHPQRDKLIKKDTPKMYFYQESVSEHCLISHLVLASSTRIQKHSACSKAKGDLQTFETLDSKSKYISRHHRIIRLASQADPF